MLGLVVGSVCVAQLEQGLNLTLGQSLVEYIELIECSLVGLIPVVETEQHLEVVRRGHGSGNDGGLTEELAV